MMSCYIPEWHSEVIEQKIDKTETHCLLHRRPPYQGSHPTEMIKTGRREDW